MAYKITEYCIMCHSCEEECPNGAISPGESTYVIDPNKCTECVGAYKSPQCADICPEEAPVPDPAHKESREQLLKKWCALHPGETPKTK